MKLKQGVVYSNIVDALRDSNIQHKFKERAQYPPKPTYMLLSTPKRLAIFSTNTDVTVFNMYWE